MDSQKKAPVPKMAYVAERLAMNKPARTSSEGTSPRNTIQGIERHGDIGSNLELQEYVGTKIDLLKKTQTAFRRAAQLGGFVPDYILNDDDYLNVPYLRKFEAVVFMTDISGFTALTEAYSLKGKGGTDQLTKTLANYMGPLAECILRSGGDIIKFAGDAFLSVWEIKTAEEYPELIQKVVDCALYCQEKYGSYLTDVGTVTRVKIGVGAGVCYATGLGNKVYHHYAVYGPGVKAASGAEHQCVPCDVILHPSAWKYCEPKHFIYTEKLDHGHGHDVYVKITDIVHFINPIIRGRPIVAQRLKNKNEPNSLPYNDAIRPSLDQNITTMQEERLRKYVIPPVLKKLDDEIPLEYLNESRMVTIVFIHCDVRNMENDPQYGEFLAEVVQSSFLTILRSATTLNGCLTKVIMFDKGLTFLLAFGLPGYIQDNQTANALNFAYKMKSALSAIPNVHEVSIGVTTGSTYCGILGHPRRHEYTVIGKKVNKAARLMIFYPGKVTCGQETFYNSKLPAHFFQLLETKVLKGISNVGRIYEYIGSELGEVDAVRKYEFPMLGRKTEFNLIMSTIQTCQQEFEKNITIAQMSHSTYDTRSATDVTSSGAWMVVLEGENGIGKSRLLSTAMVEAERLGWVVYSVALTLQHATSSLYAVTNLMLQAFDMEGIRLPTEREERLRKAAIASGDPEIIQDICTLNELLHLKLPTPQKIAFADTKARHSFAQHTLIQLLKIKYANSMILLCVDDAHYMQQTSWEYLNFISRLPSVVTLMTLRRNPDGLPKIPDLAYKICYHSNHVKTIKVPPLESKYMLPLACQLMEVKGIPTDLETIITSKSMGNPSWVENVLNELLNTEKIKIVELEPSAKLPKNTKLSYVNHQYITRQDQASRKVVRILNSAESTSESEESEAEELDSSNRGGGSPRRTRVNPEKRFCLVKSNTSISTSAVSGSIKEMLLDTYDSLNTNEQMMMKCACILDGRFSHMMLNRILPLYGRDAKKYLMSFRRLMEDRIICCASKKLTKKRSSNKIGALEAIDCYCIRDGDLDTYLEDYQNDPSMLQMPKYCYCSYAEFTKKTMGDVVYDLMTEDLKQELHLKAAKYLETTTIQCVSCGNQDSTFVYGFDLKSADLVAEDEEDIIAGTNNRKRSSKAKSTPMAEVSAKSISASMKRKPKNGSTKGDSSKLKLVQKKRGKSKKLGSLATRIHGLRRTLKNGGGQLAAIEMDILKSLIDFDKNNVKNWCSCLRGKPEDISLASADSASIVEEEKPQPSTEVIVQAPSKPKKDAQSERRISFSEVDTIKKIDGDGRATQEIVKAKSVTMASTKNESDDESHLDDYDLRDCQCALIQARICAELIKHYRKAGKFGKCLTNLLEAAESVITIGDCSKALNYLEEAAELLDGFNSGLYAIPSLDDPDDVVLIEKETNTQMTFLNGLAYFEMGSSAKAKTFFLECLKLLGTVLPVETLNRKVQMAIKSAGYALWRKYYAPACCSSKTMFKKRDKKAASMGMKIRTLSYLEKIYKLEDKVNMALLVSLLQVGLAEEMGGYMHDEVPAYCNMMTMWTSVGKHEKAHFYEKKSLNIIRENFGAEEQVDPLGLLTSANLFLTLASIRLIRGEIKSAIEASYLSLRIANVLHDNTLSCHLYPVLITTLTFTLQIYEIMEAMQKLWYTSQSDDNWAGMATYFNLCMDLIMDLCCPVESFYYCEQFVTGKDWDVDVALFREFEIQYSFECSLALWYTRYSKWEEAKSWVTRAETHRPKTISMRSVGGTLKLLQCYLISANFHQTKKRYQLFANDMHRSKQFLKELKKEMKILPAHEPRYYHLMAYYCKIRDRKELTVFNLTKAIKIAQSQGNLLEEEFVKHSRIVWSSLASPNTKYFWLENSDKKNAVDWHLPTKIPWANIMYSLPVPSWS